MAQGFRVQTVTERTRLQPNGSLGTEIVIDILTDLGARGTLVLGKQEYEALSDESLAERLVFTARSLDRPLLM